MKSEGVVKEHQADVLGVYRMIDSYNERPVYKQVMLIMLLMVILLTVMVVMLLMVILSTVMVVMMVCVQDGGENYIYYSAASCSWLVGAVVGHQYGWLRNTSKEAGASRWVPDLTSG